MFVSGRAGVHPRAAPARPADCAAATATMTPAAATPTSRSPRSADLVGHSTLHRARATSDAVLASGRPPHGRRSVSASHHDRLLHVITHPPAQSRPGGPY